MNIQQAQKISLLGYISSLGIQPEKERAGRYVCKSPFRPDEQEPSFYLRYDQQKDKWQWKDFGRSGKGGDIIDLVMELHNTNETGALLLLASPEISQSKFFPIGNILETNNSCTIKIKHIQPLQNRALVNYLASRKISQAKALNYIEECYYYSYPGQTKPYFALSFKNDEGGYELRTAPTKKNPDGKKLSTSPKAPTTIKRNPAALNIFEGFIDFLSALEYFNTTKPKFESIVLNSVTNLDTILHVLENYPQINLFLDNDDTGQQAAETIKAAHPKVKNYSKILFPKYNDFNDFLTGNIAK